MKIRPKQYTLHYRYIVEQLEVLKCACNAKRRDIARSTPSDVRAIESDGAGARVVITGNAIERSGLPRPVWPDQRVNPAMANRERQIVDRGQATALNGEIIDGQKRIENGRAWGR